MAIVVLDADAVRALVREEVERPHGPGPGRRRAPGARGGGDVDGLMTGDAVAAMLQVGRELHIANADYLRMTTSEDDGPTQFELSYAGALLGVYHDDGWCHGAAVVVDFGAEAEGER